MMAIAKQQQCHPHTHNSNSNDSGELKGIKYYMQEKWNELCKFIHRICVRGNSVYKLSEQWERTQWK